MARYFDELIVRKGSAVRTSAFSLPTSAPSAGGSAGFSLIIQGLFLAATSSFTVDVIDTGEDGLHYHIVGDVLTIDLGGSSGVTAADVALLLEPNTLVTVQVAAGGTLWVVSTSATASTSPTISYCPPFGDQQSYLVISHSDLVAGDFSIHNSDFTIETRFRVDKLYEMVAGLSPARYAILGQYDDYLWGGDVDAAPGNWWSLEFCDDEFLFRVWDAGTSAYVVNVSCPITMAWAAAWSDPCHAKLNEDPSYVHVAVCRYADEIKLFVNGVCNLTDGHATITDWDEIHQQLEINGQDGRLNPDIPYSITYVEELLLHNYAKWWSDFSTSDALFSQTGGICIYPRMFPQLLRGTLGDIEGKIIISPRIHGHLVKGDVGDIYAAKIRIYPRIDGAISRESINYERNLDDGFATSDYSGTRDNTRYILVINTNQGLP